MTDDIQPITCIVLQIPRTIVRVVVNHEGGDGSAKLRTMFLERYRIESPDRFEVPTNEGIYDFWFSRSDTTPNPLVERHLVGISNPFLQQGLEKHFIGGNVAIAFRRFAHSGITHFLDNGIYKVDPRHNHWPPVRYIPLPYDDWLDGLVKHLGETHLITPLTTVPKIAFYLDFFYLWGRSDVDRDAQKELLQRHAERVKERLDSLGIDLRTATPVEKWKALSLIDI